MAIEPNESTYYTDEQIKGEVTPGSGPEEADPDDEAEDDPQDEDQIETGEAPAESDENIEAFSEDDADEIDAEEE